MKRILSLFILFLSLHLPYSCSEDECDSFTLLESRIKTIVSSIGSVEKNTFTDITTSSFLTAAIRFEITEMEFSEIAKTRNTEYHPLVSSALACSPPEPELAYDITKITLTGESAVSLATDEVQAGESLNSIFDVANYDHASLDAFSDDLFDNKGLFGHIGAELILVMNEAPQEPISQRLTLRLDFSDGTFLELETTNFEIN
ncbi:MAG: hypothetical protein AAGF85_14615 [Bacteroidota bacterium]